MPKAFKNSEELYIYPAVFTYESENQIFIDFPDIEGCCAYAENDTQAVLYAKDVLSLALYDLEETKAEIPSPTDISKISIGENQRLFAIDVWMPYHRAKIKTEYTKKTLTIPNWLNALAMYNNVNFSQLLQQALIEYLGIENREN